jgi:hypothetical protein
MKKFTFTLFLSFLTLSIFAQKEIWVEASLKGGYGLSFLHNKNIADDSFTKYQLSTSNSFGGRFALNFGPFNGVSLEAMYNNLSQEYLYNLDGNPTDFTNTIEWASVDALILYRYIRNRIYVEVGPMYSMVQNVDQNDNGNEILSAQSFYADNYFSGVFGWGGYIAGTETFSLGIGMRLSYTFSDFINEEGQKSGYPNPTKNAPYETYETSNPAFVQFMVELNFGIGRFARTACTERMKFFRR